MTGPTESETTVDTNPVIETMSAERDTDTTLKWTVTVSDDEPFDELVTDWEYLMGKTRTFDNITYTNLASTSNPGLGLGQITALMRGYQDSDDGILQVTVCEDGANNAGTCAEGQEGSTTVTMELVAGAYQQPLICDGGGCSSQFDGSWVACDHGRETIDLNSGQFTFTNEDFSNDNLTCSAAAQMTFNYDANAEILGQAEILDNYTTPEMKR